MVVKKWTSHPLLLHFVFTSIRWSLFYVQNYTNKLHSLLTWFSICFFFIFLQQSFKVRYFPAADTMPIIFLTNHVRHLVSHDLPCDLSKAAILKEVNHRIAGLILPPSPSETKRFLPLQNYKKIIISLLICLKDISLKY